MSFVQLHTVRLPALIFVSTHLFSDISSAQTHFFSPPPPLPPFFHNLCSSFPLPLSNPPHPPTSVSFSFQDARMSSSSVSSSCSPTPDLRDPLSVLKVCGLCTRTA